MTTGSLIPCGIIITDPAGRLATRRHCMKGLTVVTRTADKGGVTRNATRVRGIDMTSTERQRRFKANMAAAGLVQVNIWVPAGSVADVQRAAELMRAAPHLTVARLGDTRTGRLVGMKGDLPARNRADRTATETEK